VSNGLASKPNLKYLRIALILNACIVVIEILGGFWTNIIAILTDALHDTGDTISISLALYLQYYSRKGSDRKFTYGYRRFSLLGAIINGVIIIAGSIFLVLETIDRLNEPPDVKPIGMMVLAIFGIAVNGYATHLLKKGTSLNEKMAATHLMQDVLGWVAVLIVSVVMLFEYIPILDPILTIVVLIWILFNVLKAFAQTFKVILQATPEGVDPESIKSDLCQLPGIIGVDDMHIWSLDGEYNIASLHLQVNQMLTLKELSGLKEVIRDMLQQYKIEHVTIEFSTPQEPEKWHDH